jgi:putative transcriptional regulator
MIRTKTFQMRKEGTQMNCKRNNLLHLLRISRNVAVETLTEILNLKNTCTYYKKESGTLRFSLFEAKVLSDFFDMTIEELFFSNEVQEIPQKKIS